MSNLHNEKILEKLYEDFLELGCSKNEAIDLSLKAFDEMGEE